MKTTCIGIVAGSLLALAACKAAGPGDGQPAFCGNGMLDEGEPCDGPAFRGYSCESLGYEGGTLACTAECGLDATACQAPVGCGDGVVAAGEECDSTDLADSSCESLGYTGGNLGCTGACRFDLSSCEGVAVCGDGEAEATEECDGADLSDQSCASLGMGAGILDCTAECEFDTSGCAAQTLCGNGTLDASEVCDDANIDNEDGCLTACSGPDDCCVPNTCGDGWVDRTPVGAAWQVEACDDGVNDGTVCREDCGQDMTLCGNNSMDQGEGCDLGGANSNTPDSVCRTNCQVAGCGDGIVDSGEECDDGNATEADGCQADCMLPACGDGIVDTGEVCDDANNNDADGCSADCLSDETCGNGVTDSVVGELCDEAAANSSAANASCRTDCQPQRCGDGILDDLAGEVCDDSSTLDGDGCSANCLSDETCGNGYVDLPVGELCDDGTANSNVPNASCRTDCQPQRCGDGLIDDAFGEQCEDGNAIDWDGCTDCRFSEFLLNSTATGGQDFPDVAMAPSGEFVVVWTDGSEDGNGDGVFGRLFTADASPLGPDFQVNTYTTGDQWQPSVAMSPSGSFVVVWHSENQDGHMYGVFGQRFAPDGSPAGGEFLVPTHTTNDQVQPKVAMSADGTFVVVWNSDFADGDSRGVPARLYNADGDPLGDEFIVNTTTAYAQDDADVAMTSDGRFVVVWTHNDWIGSDYNVYARQYDRLGNPLGPEIDVYHTIDNDALSPVVAVYPDGSFVVAYSPFSSGVLYDVYAERYSSTGSLVTSAYRVNTYTTDYQWFTDIALGGDDNLAIVWESRDQDSDNYGIYGQRIDPNDLAMGTEFRSNTFTTSSQHFPAVAAGQDGRFILVWSSPGQSGIDRSIFAQRYDPGGTPIY